MANTNVKKEAYIFKQTGEQIQAILDALEVLGEHNIRELLDLVNDIIAISKDDDDQDLGNQLLNALDKKLNVADIQTRLHSGDTSKYPPSTKVVDDAIDAEAVIREAQDNQLASDLNSETGERKNADSQIRGEITQAENRLNASIAQLRDDTSLDDKLSLNSNKGVKNKAISQAIDTLNKLFYRQQQKIETVPLNITTNFSLNFVCSSYKQSGGIPSGTWTCSNITNLYKYVTYDGHLLDEHSANSMKISRISVSDNYLENDDFEIYIDVNLNPNNPDAYPVGSMCNADGRKVYYYGNVPEYPYVMFKTDTYVRIALGIIRLPDENVSVGGSALTLTVPAKDLGSVDTMINTTTAEQIVGDIAKMPKGQTIIDSIINLPDGGTWHRGESVEHTTHEAKAAKEAVNARAGDFYLNTRHYYVYYTLDGTTWTYIGNLSGSVDQSQWAMLNSPHFTGTPTAPTPSVTNSSTQIATTEFVQELVDNKVRSTGNGAGGTALNTYKASQLLNDSGFVVAPSVGLGQWFLFQNDLRDSVEMFYLNDEALNYFSEPIDTGQTRLCVITDFAYKTGIDTEQIHNGYVYVMPVHDTDRITKLEARVTALEANAKG